MFSVIGGGGRYGSWSRRSGQHKLRRSLRVVGTTGPAGVVVGGLYELLLNLTLEHLINPSLEHLIEPLLKH